MRGEWDVIELLLNHGANEKVVDKQGHNASFAAFLQDPSHMTHKVLNMSRHAPATLTHFQYHPGMATDSAGRPPVSSSRLVCPTLVSYHYHLSDLIAKILASPAHPCLTTMTPPLINPNPNPNSRALLPEPVTVLTDTTFDDKGERCCNGPFTVTTPTVA